MISARKKERESGRAGERENAAQPGSTEESSSTGTNALEGEDAFILDDELSPALPRSRAPALSLCAPPEAQDQRIDLFLAAQFNTASRSAIQRAISDGKILVNAQQIKPSHRLSAGELIVGTIPQAPPIEAQAENIPLDIVYEDDSLIVINKPAGMVTHPGAGVKSGTLANALVYHLQQQAADLPKRGGVSRPGIVHRLDAGTSGLLVAAKTDQAHLSLAAQFEARTVNKLYTALVYGQVEKDEGSIDAPIGRDPRSRVKMAVVKDGRVALTLYRVAERFAEFSRLEVEIKTGRTHQIRVHLAQLKHPIVGDTTYDGGRANQLKDAKLRASIAKLQRPFLHAARLSFAHPVSGERLEFTAALPPDLQAFLALLTA
jgi:23S rRNA pseudouridine1911/1915/1917 synthase